MSLPDIDEARFRQLLGRFATGVAVLTTLDEGRPVGMTASSLSSVSLEPPLISVCIGHAATLHDLLVTAPGFVVNVLSATQEALARRFAGEHPDRFDGVGCATTDRGLVLLDGALVHIEVERHDTAEAGDHTIVIARVVGGGTTTDPNARPLLYYRGGYGELG